MPQCDLGRNQLEGFCNRIKSPHVHFGTRRPLVWVLDLLTAAFEWVQSIEGAFGICRVVRIRTAPLALPLGELSPQATERVLWQSHTLSVFAPLRHLSQRERQGMPEKTLGSAQICQSPRERSKKTEAVFLVGSRRSGGKSKSLRAPFLFATFSFGEAKEKVGRQSQICRSVSAFCLFPIPVYCT